MPKREEGQTTQDIAAALSLASVHKLDPADTSHLSDRRRKRQLPCPATEERHGGYAVRSKKGNGG